MTTFRPVIQELQKIIENDPDLYMGFCQMFERIAEDPKHKVDPLGNPQIRDYRDMLKLFDTLLTYAPDFVLVGSTVQDPLAPKIIWPMCTTAGFRVFTNPQVNAQLQKTFNVWADFLSSPESCHVLTDQPNGWFGPEARKALPDFEGTYECDTNKEHHGFTPWDNFFTRRFRPGVRPVSRPEDDTVIVNACEPVVYKISHNVHAMSPFWLKGQPYSLNRDALNPLVERYIKPTLTTTVGIAPLVALFLLSRCPAPTAPSRPPLGLSGENPNSGVTRASQAFMTHLPTRILIFIQASHADVGLMCFIGVGMVEVSSCEATVAEGQWVRKGDQLGLFHYGGSTHCMMFRPETKVVFSDGVFHLLEDGVTKVPINSCVGYVSTVTESE